MNKQIQAVLISSAVSLIAAGSLSGQTVYYDVTWSGGGATASARVAIDTSVSAATDGVLHQYSSPADDFSTLWIQLSQFSITAGSTTILPTQDDLTSLSWASSSPVDPTKFYFNADDSTLGGTAWQITGVPDKGFQLVLDPSGSATTYNMPQASFSAVPEPEEWAAIASGGLLAFGIWHRRSRKAKKA
jgi:hypothetical protein